MPHRAPAACPDPGCANLRPCPDHPPTSPWGRAMPRGWPVTRARILARDGHRCVQCGSPAGEVHHAIYGREDDASLVSLCSRCHTAITAQRSAAARQAVRQCARWRTGSRGRGGTPPGRHLPEHSCSRASAARFRRFWGRDNGRVDSPRCPGCSLKLGQCPVCGTVIATAPGRGRPRTYCSPECRWKRGHQRARAQAAPAELSLDEIAASLRAMAPTAAELRALAPDFAPP